MEIEGVQVTQHINNLAILATLKLTLALSPIENTLYNNIYKEDGQDGQDKSNGLNLATLKIKKKKTMMRKRRRPIYYGECTACGNTQKIKFQDWLKKNKPKCTQCGEFLECREGRCIPPLGCEKRPGRCGSLRRIVGGDYPAISLNRPSQFIIARRE